MAYFHIMAGLRGCYMPDNACVIQCDTRKALKRALMWEADSIRDAGFIGISKRDVAWAAAKAWRERGQGTQSAILPYGRRGEGKAFSIEITGASRAGYLEQSSY